MRREDLRAIEGLTEEQIDEIMRLHGQDAATYQATYRACRRSWPPLSRDWPPLRAWMSTTCAVRSPT